MTYGSENCIIFKPNGVGSYNAGDIFDVVITGLDGKIISYTVKFF